MSRKDRIYFSFQQNYFIYFNAVLLTYLKHTIPPASINPRSAFYLIQIATIHPLDHPREKECTTNDQEQSYFRIGKAFQEKKDKGCLQQFLFINFQSQ